jgi:hypothetical protein
VADRLGLSAPEAEAFVRLKLAELQSGSYESSVELEFDDGTVSADVYGFTDEHGGWYVKFHVEHGQVQVTSFHAPEYEMTCSDGTRVKGS